MLYRRAQHEIFALFGDCSRWDGMVEKLILYAVGGWGCWGGCFLGRACTPPPLWPASFTVETVNMMTGRSEFMLSTEFHACGQYCQSHALAESVSERVTLLHVFVSICQDDERTIQSEVRETFQRRKDKLTERRTFPQKVGAIAVVLPSR
jgi:hypothetical protein